MSYLVNDPIAEGTAPTGECAKCGAVQEYEICEDCQERATARQDAMMRFKAALPDDLQAAFDHEAAIFNSGHEVSYVLMSYIISSPDKAKGSEFSLREAVQWCTVYREDLK